jgi:hypothetical protein
MDDRPSRGSHGVQRMDFYRRIQNHRSRGVAEFSNRYYCQFGFGSQFKHTTPILTDAAEKLAGKLASVPDLTAIARELGKPTVGK